MSHSPESSRRRTLLSAASAVLVLVLALVWWLVAEPPADEPAPAAAPTWSATVGDYTAAPVPGPPQRSPAPTSKSASKSASKSTSKSTAAQAPARVLRTLALIDAGDWPEAAAAPGTKGGQTFRNNERRLPTTGADGRRLAFQEWDVNPKQPGRGRDAERIITADDGSAWYTLDHYRTFVLIRGPAR
ncbi:ribonuclease domain-containing protein [Gordonia phosphorivorans]|uniref:Ribonuclease domain-containing protein n=1 Tax=Gordonia phosphorivorans TaxID=1056982 RepID=A0ABV6H8T6_9ACTN